MIVTITDIQNAIYKAQNMVYAIALNITDCYEQGGQPSDEKYELATQLQSYIDVLGRVDLDENDCIESDEIWEIISWINGNQVLAEMCLVIPAQYSNPGQPIPVPDSGCCGVETVTGPQVDNTDPKHPVVGVYGDGTTITGAGTFADPFVAVGGGGGSGTVSSGAQYRLAYYAAAGTTVSNAPAITGSRALKSDANGVPTHFDTATEPSLTELTYVKGVTSAIQTQLNAKVDNGSVTGGDLTMNTARILGRTTAAAGAIEEITIGTGLSLSAGNLTATGSALVEVTGNITAANDTNYIQTASATFTDPSPVQGKGFTVFVRAGTATVGGVAYATGALIYRYYDSVAWTNTVYFEDTIPIVHQFNAGTNPLDATNYYIGEFPDLGLTTTATGRKSKLNGNYRVIAANIQIITAGVLGTNESSTLSIRIDNTTDVLVSNAVKFNVVLYQEFVTGLAIDILSTEHFQSKLLTATFATNPTIPYGTITYYAKRIS